MMVIEMIVRAATKDGDCETTSNTMVDQTTRCANAGWRCWLRVGTLSPGHDHSAKDDRSARCVHQLCIRQILAVLEGEHGLQAGGI